MAYSSYDGTVKVSAGVGADSRSMCVDTSEAIPSGLSLSDLHQHMINKYGEDTIAELAFAMWKVRVQRPGQVAIKDSSKSDEDVANAVKDFANGDLKPARRTSGGKRKKLSVDHLTAIAESAGLKSSDKKFQALLEALKASGDIA